MNIEEAIEEALTYPHKERLPTNSSFRGIAEAAETLAVHVNDLREFIRYWSYCTRQGLLKYCPEKREEWNEAMSELCPGGLPELAVSDLVNRIPGTELTADD